MKRIKISEELRQQVFERDNFTCRYCGRKRGPFHADHVYPSSRGGETTLENLVTACQICNIKKSSAVGIWPNPIEADSAVDATSNGLVLIAIGAVIVSISFVLPRFPFYDIHPSQAVLAGILVILLGAYFHSKGI